MTLHIMTTLNPIYFNSPIYLSPIMHKSWALGKRLHIGYENVLQARKMVIFFIKVYQIKKYKLGYLIYPMHI
jgi:hypothetical protein